MAPKLTRADSEMGVEDALIHAVAEAMIHLDASASDDEVDGAEQDFRRNVAAIEKRFQTAKPRASDTGTLGGLLARGQRYRDMVTARTVSRKRELKQDRRHGVDEPTPGASRRAVSDEAVGTGQFVGRLAGELRDEAEAAGIAWETVLDESALTKASRSRINHGTAGLTTLERVRTALARLRAQVPIERTPEPRTPRPATEQLRWVVVERTQGGMFAGRTSTADSEVAERGYVRLQQCRSIRGEADPSELANWGPGARADVGAPAPSVLVIGIASVYDCTAEAALAFQSTGGTRRSPD